MRLDKRLYRTHVLYSTYQSDTNYAVTWPLNYKIIPVHYIASLPADTRMDFKPTNRASARQLKHNIL